MRRFTAVLLLGACPLLGCSSAPVQEMSDARQAIVAARAAGATESNSPDFYAAQAAIARAETDLQAQDYARARYAAVQAKLHAGVALTTIEHAGEGSMLDPVAAPGAATSGGVKPGANTQDIASGIAAPQTRLPDPQPR